jgi:hypothetical protein
MSELKLWTNDIDIVIAESAEEALALLIAETGVDEEDAEEYPFYEWESDTIKWWEECGYGEPVEMTPAELIKKVGKRGVVGTTEC